MASRSCFYVVCSGSVETCEITGGDNLFCQFSYNTGKDWGVVHGTESGLSQIAKRSNNSVTWNYPLEVTFKSTNVHGWPQLVILVCGYNFWNQQVVRGYGCVHIPPTPGRHVRHIPLYTPLSSSWFMQCINWMTGNHAEFMEHNFVARSRGREVTRVRSNGHVKVVLNVMTKNMNDFGYSVDSERWQDAGDGSSQAIKLLARAPLTAPSKQPQTDHKDYKHPEPTKPQTPMEDPDEEPAAPSVSVLKRPAQIQKQQPMDFDTELRPSGGAHAAGKGSAAPASTGGVGYGSGGSGGTGISGDGASAGADVDYDSKYPIRKGTAAGGGGGSGSARGQRIPARSPAIDNESDDGTVAPSTAAAPAPASAGGGGLAPIKKRSFAPVADTGSSGSGGGAGAAPLRKKTLEPLTPSGGGNQTPVKVSRPAKARAAPVASDDLDEPADDVRPRDGSDETNDHTPLRGGVKK